MINIPDNFQLKIFMGSRIILFKTMLMDSQPIFSNQTTYSFFNDNDENETSVTLMSEGEALEWLFKNSIFRRFFLEQFFSNPDKQRIFLRVKEPLTRYNYKPGDIDLLIIDPNNPANAIAFECKRVKSVAINEETSKINSIQKIREGVKQASALQSLGFNKSYLLILLLDDGRALLDPNTMFRYGKTPEISQMYDLPWNEPLQRDVGIVFVKVNQMTGKSINHSISVGICIEKQAERLDQLNSLTEKIIEILKHPEDFNEV
ncbi:MULTISPECIES: hypothetical protein [Niastella]|uniref:Type I restriction enzyme R protein N-terminal domain-containing protein n=1 Tax=Niastella soli TaxID=2821487 RepID=A0ABS3Z206_9BACT|nr:hypothetical protein [Niastella soli]MBO9204202.1 hypothetical protein [Niastella soli]